MITGDNHRGIRSSVPIGIYAHNGIVEIQPPICSAPAAEKVPDLGAIRIPHRKLAAHSHFLHHSACQWDGNDRVVHHGARPIQIAVRYGQVRVSCLSAWESMMRQPVARSTINLEPSVYIRLMPRFVVWRTIARERQVRALAVGRHGDRSQTRTRVETTRNCLLFARAQLDAGKRSVSVRLKRQVVKHPAVRRKSHCRQSPAEAVTAIVTARSYEELVRRVEIEIRDLTSIARADRQGPGRQRGKVLFAFR